MAISEQANNTGGWATLSKEHTIWESEWGQICLFSGCAGRFYDLYNPQGVYLETVGTLESAKTLLKQHAASSAQTVIENGQNVIDDSR